MVADFDSDNAVLIHYRGGAYGNFIFHVVGKHVSNTVKINNQNFVFSHTGNSHSTVKYVNTYYLAGQLKKKLKSYTDYKYIPYVTDHSAWQQMQDGKKFLVLCDTSVIDNHRYLLSTWPNSVMIRSYMPNIVDRLVGYANLIHKALQPDEAYKNSIFDNQTMQQFKNQGGDLDQTIEEAIFQDLQKNFNLYGKTFNRAVIDNRVFNFDISCLKSWQVFEQTINDLSKFLNGTVINTTELEQLYQDFYKTQPNLKYYKFTKDTIPDPDDLIGRALVRFYQQ